MGPGAAAEHSRKDELKLCELQITPYCLKKMTSTHIDMLAYAQSEQDFFEVAFDRRLAR